jgi:CheY-like chemotaxis protein
MDVQMPEMDGLEAARRIAPRWPPRAPRIVAMTANAMQGDREACLAAGMDDYLTKPIRVDALVAALASTAPRIDAQEADAMSSAAIDPHTFDELQANAGADFVAELVDTFAEEAPPLVAELRAALAAGAAERFRRAAHSLKSNSSTFGAVALADRARALELGGLPATPAASTRWRASSRPRSRRCARWPARDDERRRGERLLRALRRPRRESAGFSSTASRSRSAAARSTCSSRSSRGAIGSSARRS